MEATKCKKVILDVDVGTDDYLALLIFFYADRIGKIRIEAIVCTMGNTTIDNVCNNVVRLLEIVGRTDIPVYKGATKPLIPPDHEIKKFHGADGFGCLQYETEPNINIINKEPAAAAITDLVNNNPNEITLICVAPLTNVALAMRLDDAFVDNIKEIWIMGGNYTAVGNITSSAEYNFYIDPEAAYIVLDSLKKPIFILTWETCLYPQISFEWRYNIFGKKKNPAIELLNRAEKSIYGKDEKIWLPCDAFLAAAFLYPDTFIKKKSSHNATVELSGIHTRGQIVLDHLKMKQENVTIIEEIDSEIFMELLMKL